MEKRAPTVIFFMIIVLLTGTFMASCASTQSGSTTAAAETTTAAATTAAATTTTETTAAPAADSSEGITTINFLASGGSHTTIAEYFNETHDDVQIALDNSPSTWGDTATKLITMIAADMAPDITTVSTSYYPQFTAQGVLMDMTEYVETNLNRDDYFWPVIEGLYRDGALYGLPISVYTLVCYYNRDMFEEAGIEPPSLDWKNTWTMEEWREIGTKLSGGEGLDRVYGAWVEYQLERTACFLFPRGLDYWGEDLYPQFDNKEIRDIHEELYKMVHVDKIIPDSATTQTTSIMQMFADGKLAMFITGTWDHTNIVQSNINYGVLPTPGGKTVGYVDVYIPYKGSKNPETTKEVMLWLIGEEVASIKYKEYTWGPQVSRLATENNMEIMFAGLTDEEKQCVFDGLDNSRPLTVFDKWAEFLTASLLPASELMGTGEYTVDQGFDQLQEEALALLGFE